VLLWLKGEGQTADDGGSAKRDETAMVGFAVFVPKDG